MTPRHRTSRICATSSPTSTPWLNIYYGAAKDYTLYVVVALGGNVQPRIEFDRTTVAAAELLSAIDYAVDPNHPAKAHLTDTGEATA